LNIRAEFLPVRADCIDKISISNWKDIWWEGLERDIESGLRGVIVDEKPVQLVQRRRETDSLFDLFIELDNETSPAFSIIEIFTQDRLGLLYDISRCCINRE
jgi:UTP:GlnB (protein PII) uridylyltransferase